MRAKIIQIGNSRGIRIPKPILEQCGIEDCVELEIHDHELVIRTKKKPREGWNGQYERMADSGDDQLLIAEEPNQWDEEGWEW